MSVNIGDRPDHGFDQPLSLMSDCHRRVEKFLSILLRVAEDVGGGRLGDQYLTAMESAQRYFKNAAPWHTRDEEDSLFPRLRELDNPDVHEVLASVDALERDHRDAKGIHDEVDRLCTLWREQGTLAATDLQRLRSSLSQLQQTYTRHIALEDNVIFPLAQRRLPQTSLLAIGREMAQRRGIDPRLPKRRCRHADRHSKLSTQGQPR